MKTDRARVGGPLLRDGAPPERDQVPGPLFEPQPGNQVGEGLGTRRHRHPSLTDQPQGKQHVKIVCPQMKEGLAVPVLEPDANRLLLKDAQGI